MAAVVTCPKCQTRLKLNKVPTELTKIQCPHCQHAFAVSVNGVTAKPSAPKSSAGQPLLAPAPRSHAAGPAGHPIPKPMARGPAPARAPLIGAGMGTAIVLAILAVGAAGIAAIIYTRPAPTTDGVLKTDNGPKDPKDTPEPAPPPKKRDKKHADSQPKDKDKFQQDYLKLEELKKVEKTAKENEEKLKTDLALLLKQGKDALEIKQFTAAEDCFKKALERAPGNDEATKGLLAVRAALAQADLERRFFGLLDSAKSNLDAGRYPDAIRDASAAQQVSLTNINWVNQAMAVQQAAEKQLTMLKGDDERKQAFARIMDQGATALRERRFPEAKDAFNGALMLVPGDAAAAKGLADAEQGNKQLMAQLAIVQNQYQVFMAQGAQAMAAFLFADAVNYFAAASNLMPADPAAQAALLNAMGARDRANAYQMAMQRGRNAMALGQFADALLAYSNALLNVPNDPFAMQGRTDAQQLLLGQMQTKEIVDFKLLQAGLLLQKKDYIPARDLYIDAAKIMPSHPNILITNNLARYADLMARAKAAGISKQFGDAVNAYLDALRTIADDPPAKQGLLSAMDLGRKLYVDSMDKGKKALDGKNFPEAVARYTDAVRSLATDPLADVQFPDLPQFRADAALGLAEAQRQGKERYDDDMVKGKLALDARNYADAVARYTDALSIIPNDPPAQQGLSDAQRFQQAARDFDGKVQQANQYLRQRRFSDARDLFNSLVVLAPTPTQSQAMKDQAGYADAMDRGQTAMTLQRFPDAVLAYNDALRIVPRDIPATQGLQEAQRQMSGTDLAGNFGARVKLAEQLLTQQKYAEASKAFTDAIAMQPQDPSVAALQVKARYADAMARGQTSLATKSFSSALLAYGDALKAMPQDAAALAGQQEAQRQLQGVNVNKDVDARVKLAEQLLTGQKYNEANKAFTDVVNLIPGDPRAQALQTKANFAAAMAQGQSAMKGKQYASAVTAFTTALAQIANNPAALQGLQDAQRLTNTGQDLANKLAIANTALQQQKYFEASKAFNQAIALLPPNDPQATVLGAKVRYADAMANARTAMDNKKYQDAVGFYNTALLAQAGDATASLGLQEAQRLSQGAVARQSFDSKVNQGNLLLAKHKYAEASKAFSDAVAALPPGDMKAAAAQKLANYADAMARGKAAMGLSNFTGAIDAFTDAARNAPVGDTTAQLALQDATQRQAQAGAAAQNRKDFDSKVNQANKLIFLQRYAEASQMLNDALKVIPDNQVQAKANYADAMAKGTRAMSMTPRNVKEARRQFRIALDNVPNDQAAMSALNNANKAK